MRIPSYDDLTPSIPDITPRETLAQVGQFLPPRRQESDPVSPPGRTAPPVQLFGCLRSTRPPGVMLAIAREFSPRIERHGAACVVLDVSGLGRLLGDACAIGDALASAAGHHAAASAASGRTAASAASGRTAASAARGRAAAGAAADRAPIRVAVAPTQTAARLMTIVHPRLMVLAGDMAAALAPVPLRALRVLVEEGGPIPGEARARAVARAAATSARLETFHRWGLTTLGEIAALPPDGLFERMGPEGLLLQQLARGVDPAPLVPDPGTPRFIGSMELEWPLDALEPLSFVLARLLDPLAEALERADRGAAAVRLDLRLVDRTAFARVLQLPAAMRDPKVLRTLLLLDLESHPPPAAIDVVTIEIDPAPARIIQYSLLERALPSAETLATLTARLRALVGETRCGSPALLDTHRPDGFEMRSFAPESGLRTATAQRAVAGQITGAPAEAARAPRLGREAATGGLAVARIVCPASEGGRAPGPELRAPSLRRFRPPVAVRVTVDRGGPAHVAIDRRGMPGGPVEQRAGPWRTAGAWWDSGGTAWDRDEWDVALGDGSLCRLFRDRLSGRWFVEGIFD